ncbi:hypothetical protein ACTXPD_04530 [Vreelandella alkaliphila]|uniref:hypothetical protein n=1 Tax=Vreelandella alkaliphila TaxID=272774 RepID=UPI003FD8F191
MTDTQTAAAGKRILAAIEEAREDFAQQGHPEPLAQAVGAILTGNILAHDRYIRQLREDMSALTDLLAEAE